MKLIPPSVTLDVENMPGTTWEFAIPDGWMPLSTQGNILAFFFLSDGCQVGVNAFGHDGHVWLHASVSRPDRLPTYGELCNLKTAVFGAHGVCAQVFEAEQYHVNIHPNCLHLWGPRMPSIWPLPRFTGGTI